MIDRYYRSPRIFLLAWLALFALLPGWLAGQAAPAYPDPAQVRALYEQVQSDHSASQEEQIKSAIDSFFRLRYEGQRRMQAQDFSYLVGKGEDALAWQRKAQDKQEIELAVAAAYQLAYQAYEYRLDYESLQVQGRLATVRLYESHTVTFQALAPEVSRLGRLPHTFQLQRTGEGWKILSDVYVDELAFVLAGESKERILSRVQSRPAMQTAVSDQERRDRQWQESNDRLRWESIAPYDRRAAVAYADAWGRWVIDPEHWRNPIYHDEPGYDCANYVSQAIYAGAGQIMSEPTHYESLWYYDFFTHSGSLPWLRVSSFANFVLSQSETGPVGALTSRLCDMQPGDVVQLYSASGWFHEILVTGRLVGKKCAAQNAVLINAHTTDLYHYPLAYFAFTSLRYIHLRGVAGRK